MPEARRCLCKVGRGASCKGSPLNATLMCECGASYPTPPYPALRRVLCAWCPPQARMRSLLDGITHTVGSILLRISPPHASEGLGHLQRPSSVGSTGYWLSLSSHHLPERHRPSYFSSSSALGRRGPWLLQLPPAEGGAGHGGGGGIVGGASRLLSGGGALPLADGGRRHHGRLPPPGRAGGPRVLRKFQRVFAAPFSSGRRTRCLG